jgi:hypothetical protein
MKSFLRFLQYDPFRAFMFGVLVCALVAFCSACGGKGAPLAPCTAFNAWRAETTWYQFQTGAREVGAILYQCQ